MLIPLMGNKLSAPRVARRPAQSWDAVVTKGVHWPRRIYFSQGLGADCGPEH